MKRNKQLGIWMDHSTAFLTDLKKISIVQNKVNSEPTREIKVNSMLRGEKHMHLKEQRQQLDFYKKLSDVILNYNEVVLFGPTDAKDELYNYLKADRLFENIMISVQHADKMTEKQIHAFVRAYFK